MNILLTGPTGLIGRALIKEIQERGDTFTGLTRSREPLYDNQAHWNPDSGDIDLSSLEGHDAVINLAGETITGRWTPEKKERIVTSRLNSAELLVDSILRLESKPKVFIGASAVGFYGDRSDEVLTEDSAPGRGFFPDLSQKWESKLVPLEEAGIRVVNLRIGVVLSEEGGALKEMLLPFKFGLGGRIGNGRQYWSWIAIDDVVGAIFYCIENENMKGPVNIVAPGSVTNSQFTEELGKALGRPTVFPVPAFAARALFGEMADEAILSSVRVEPEKLLESGYKFKHTDLLEALKDILS